MSDFPARQGRPGIQLLLVLSTFLSGPSPAGAQNGVTANDAVHPDEVHLTMDTLWLGELHALAARADPRAEEVGFLERRSRLRSTDIRMGRLPSLSATASAQFVSQVAQLPDFPGPRGKGHTETSTMFIFRPGRACTIPPWKAG